WTDRGTVQGHVGQATRRDREGQAGHAPRRYGSRQYVGLPHRTGRNEHRSESSSRTVSGRRRRHQCPGGGKGGIAQGVVSEFRGLADAGKVRPIGVAASERLSFLKDTPTMNEALGGNEYQWFVIRFAVVPKGTPEDRKAYLGTAIRAAMK